MNRVAEIERRRPELLVAAAFLWAPVILITTLALTDDREIIIPALLVAALPYLGILGWMLFVVLKEAAPVRRGIILLCLFLFAAFAVGVNWGPPLVD